jgi:hypothetical protein
LKRPEPTDGDSTAELRAWAGEAGFGVRAQWVDEEWPFVQALLEAA